ncbi:DUF4097 domain-containing protein [Prescottella defluvii]|uniref:DUF4097 family beta strand repeat-containing protein n=1 Tax=Prescottella defluvii TaxID=1323361 RepID=UPI0004F27F2A|nr:DUF4097 family beta strand repeat-containing protein [Prescottella defluvii]
MTRLAWTRRIVAALGAAVVVTVAGALVSALLAWAFNTPRGHGFTYSSDALSTGPLSVRATSGTVNVAVEPSSDDRIHVSADGNYRGGSPRIDVADTGDAVDIMCPDAPYWSCSVSVTVSVPARTEVTAYSVAGSIFLTDLTGPAQATTIHGDITIRRHQGSMVASAVAGSIAVSAVDASFVSAATDVGDIRITADTPPDAVSARTSHGDIAIGVPNDVTYALRTTSAGTAAATIGEDLASSYRIDAVTSDGVITIFPS